MFVKQRELFGNTIMFLVSCHVFVKNKVATNQKYFLKQMNTKCSSQEPRIFFWVSFYLFNIGKTKHLPQGHATPAPRLLGPRTFG